MTTAAGNPIIDRALEDMRAIEEKFREFMDKVRDLLDWVPSALESLVQPVIDLVNYVNGKFAEYQNSVRLFWTDTGDPEKLKQVGKQWIEEFSHTIDEIAEALGLDKLKANIYWQGRAAKTYEAAVPAQIEHLDSMKDLGEQMRDSLSNLANGIDSFWLAMKVIIGGLLAAIASAILSAITVVGLPLALGILSAAIAAAVPAITGTIVAIEALLDVIETEQNSIQAKVDDLGDQWERTSTSTMSHPGDWRVN
jgi:phage-related minor tail protein